MNIKLNTERSQKIASCIALFFIGLTVLFLGVVISKVATFIGIIIGILGGLAAVLGIVPMIAFWCSWQDLSG